MERGEKIAFCLGMAEYIGKAEGLDEQALYREELEAMDDKTLDIEVDWMDRLADK